MSVFLCVCLSVCLLTYCISKMHIQTSRNVLFLYVFSSAVAWCWQWNALCSSGFVDDVLFSPWWAIYGIDSIYVSTVLEQVVINFQRICQVAPQCLTLSSYIPHTTHTTVLRPFFWDHPGEPVPEENFWTLWCKGRLTEADTLTIRLGATPSRLTSAHLHHPIIYRPDAFPAAQPTVSKHWRQVVIYSDGKLCTCGMTLVMMTSGIAIGCWAAIR